MKKNASTLIRYWLVISLLFLTCLPFPAQAVTAHSPAALLAIQLLVDTLLDFNDLSYQVCSPAPDDCSLRGAISKANLDPQHLYELTLPAGTYLLSIPGAFEDANASGDLDVLGSLRLVGAGAAQTILSAQAIDRVLDVFWDASLTLQGLSISGGKTPDGEPGDPGTSSEGGGGLSNRGYLVLVDSAVQGNQTGAGGAGSQETGSGGSSGNGGGILNHGRLTVDHSTVTNNRTGQGGVGASPPLGNPECGSGGNSGHGGGIYNTGTLLLKDSQIVSNIIGSAGQGGISGWKSEPCNGGEGGSGGGVYNTFIMQVQSSALKLNQAGSGGRVGGKGGDGGGIYSSIRLEIAASQIDGNLAGGGQPGGHGGGIASSGNLKVSDSQVTANASGDGVFAADPGGAGGGIYSTGQAVISYSLIEGNRTGRGGSGIFHWGWYNWSGGPGGSGGGIANLGSLVLDNTPIQGNQTGLGGDGGSDDGAGLGVGGEGGSGGGLYNAGTASLWNSPLSSNAAGAGGNALGDFPEEYGQNGSGGAGGSGAGIYNSGDLTLAHSPVADNTAGTGGVGDVTSGPGGSGGGIYNAGLLASRFSAVTGNSAGTGGSDEISPGGKGGDGGGIYNDASMVNLGSLIVQNNAGSGGSPESLNGDGGGLFLSENGVLELTSTVVAENEIRDGAHGSGMRLNNYATLLHTTLAGNHGGDGSGVYFAGPSLTLTNSIVVAHAVGIFAEEGIVFLGSTLWGSGEWANGLDYAGAGISTISDYYGLPDFVDPAHGDYHLLPSSPAIDQGILTSAKVDIDNQVRPYLPDEQQLNSPATGLPDLGADEYWQLVPLSGVTLQWQSPVTSNMQVTLTALTSPADATPNLVYNWSPYPESGQGTAQAVYRWPLAGAYPVSVTVWNAGSRVTDSALVSVQFGPQAVFLPVIQNR